MSDDRRTVLVTGAAGSIGRRAVLMLAEHGFLVHAVDNRTEVSWPENVVFHQADIRKRSFDRALRAASPSSPTPTAIASTTRAPCVCSMQR
ncbi:MAG: NAD-dependent epimerase/dehydratase family protein [Deltaproteobacteria bacterium]|nr:NAD-dependent epimerase/dehydratase family protein [Deltaproteobacteria bacterium]